MIWSRLKIKRSKDPCWTCTISTGIIIDTVWFKVYGCNTVVCGTRSIGYDFDVTTHPNYTVTYQNGVVTILKKVSVPKLDKRETYEDVSRRGVTKDEVKLNRNRVVPIVPVGCGAYLRWSNMQDVTEYVLNTIRVCDDTSLYTVVYD